MWLGEQCGYTAYPSDCMQGITARSIAVLLWDREGGERRIWPNRQCCGHSKNRVGMWEEVILSVIVGKWGETTIRHENHRVTKNWQAHLVIPTLNPSDRDSRGRFIPHAYSTFVGVSRWYDGMDIVCSNGSRQNFSLSGVFRTGTLTFYINLLAYRTLQDSDDIVYHSICTNLS